MKIDLNDMTWTRPPKNYKIENNALIMKTDPHTDLWQRTYYYFRNDNAPCLQMETEEEYFSFVVRAEYDTGHAYEQAGVVVYLDSENWIKASVEYENEEFQHVGVVVTNNGYSDWSTAELPLDKKSVWYRLSRRKDDYKVEYSFDGNVFHQMRICHFGKGLGKIRFGIFACSPEDSSFEARFDSLELRECEWMAHTGQQPDADLIQK